MTDKAKNEMAKAATPLDT